MDLQRLGLISVWNLSVQDVFRVALPKIGGINVVVSLLTANLNFMKNLIKLQFLCNILFNILVFAS